MGLFGHGGKISEIGHKVEHTLKKLGISEVYVGASTNGNGNIQPKIQINSNGRYNYGNVEKSSGTAYKANAAGTANKIAQGGMTKDDILKYNKIHPNEIAGDKPANTTALNTNTAMRS